MLTRRQFLLATAAVAILPAAGLAAPAIDQADDHLHLGGRWTRGHDVIYTRMSWEKHGWATVVKIGPDGERWEETYSMAPPTPRKELLRDSPLPVVYHAA